MNAGSLNNLLVEGLKTGRAQGIKTLLDLGQGPFVLIDYVERHHNLMAADEPITARRSIWFWIHQAPIAEAVELCWDARFHRELSALGERSKAELLNQAMDEALQGALSSGHFAPWMASWEAASGYVRPMAPDALLDRGALLTAFRRGLIAHGEGSVGLLEEMNAQSHLTTSDMQAWFKAGDYLPELVSKAFPKLLQASLDIGGTPPSSALKAALSCAEANLGNVLEQGAGEYMMNEHGNRVVACMKTLAASSPDYRLPEGLSKSCLASLDLPTEALIPLRDMALSLTWTGVAVSPSRRHRF